MKSFYCTLVCFCTLVALPMSAQISFSHNAIVISDEATKQVLTLTNHGSQTKEVEISTRFGSPATDTLGRTFMMYPTAMASSNVTASNALAPVVTSSHDATPLVSCTPRKLIIPPGQTDTVTFQCRDAKDGIERTYWMRVGVTSRNMADVSGPQAAAEEGAPDEILQSIPLLYIHGHADVGLSERRIVSVRDQAGVQRIMAEVAPTGTSPFLGMVAVVVYHNNEVDTNYSIAVNLYRSERIQLLPARLGLESGEYDFHLYWTLGRGETVQQYCDHYKTEVDHFVCQIDESGDIVLKQ